MCFIGSNTSAIIQTRDYIRGIRDSLLVIRILYWDSYEHLRRPVHSIKTSSLVQFRKEILGHNYLTYLIFKPILQMSCNLLLKESSWKFVFWLFYHLVRMLNLPQLDMTCFSYPRGRADWSYSDTVVKQSMLSQGQAGVRQHKAAHACGELLNF